MKKLILPLALILVISGCVNPFQKNIENEIDQEVEVDESTGRDDSSVSRKVSLNDVVKISKSKRAGWSVYRHEVLGIQFEYKTEWGEPVLSPVAHVTRLRDVNGPYKGQTGNAFKNKLELRFQGADVPSLDFNFYDNGVETENCGVGYPVEGHCVESFNRVISTGDICDLNITAADAGTKVSDQTYKVCENNVSTIISYKSTVESYYNYNFSMFAYEKLNNGFFDNLFIDYQFLRVQLQDSTKGTPEKLIPATVERGKEFGWEIYSEDYEGQKADFEYLVNSIETFSTDGVIKANVRPGKSANTNHQLIYTYYLMIATGQLEGAFEMNVGGTLSQFKSWYENVYNAEVSDITKLDNGDYEFIVELYEHNSPTKTYKVVKSVKDGKLVSVSSGQILSEIKYDKNLYAQAIKEGDSIVVYLYQNGEETIIDQADDVEHDMYTNGFLEARVLNEFSPDGRFINVGFPGWEWYSEKLFDIENGEYIDVTLNNPKFTPDGKYLYDCSFAGMGTDLGFDVVKLEPNVEILRSLSWDDFIEGVYGVECEFNKDEYTLDVKYLGSDPKEPSTAVDYLINEDIYNFAEDKFYNK